MAKKAAAAAATVKDSNGTDKVVKLPPPRLVEEPVAEDVVVTMTGEPIDDDEEHTEESIDEEAPAEKTPIISRPRRVLRRVKIMMAHLAKVDWAALDVPEGPRAIATLALAAAKLAQIKAPARGRAALEGQTVRVKATARATYEGLLDEPDLDALVVVAVRKSTAICKTAGGERVMLPVRHVEATEAAQ
jgi:hypothetical protein